MVIHAASRSCLLLLAATVACTDGPTPSAEPGPESTAPSAPTAPAPPDAMPARTPATPVEPELPVAPPAPPVPLASLCAAKDTTCSKYLPLWREIVIERSGIDSAYFDAHVGLLRAESSTWNDGTSVRVRYRFTIDWMALEREDSFVVQTSLSAAPYPAVGVPLGTVFDKAQIARAADAQAWGTTIARIERVSALKFRTQDEALAALRAQPDGSALEAESLSFERPGMLPRQNGHPHLHARSPEGLDKSNRCSTGMIDLVTGEASVIVNACRMTGGRSGGVAP